jgi:hypothetical protein
VRDGEIKYLRLRVENLGLSTAKNVQVMIISIAVSSAERPFDGEVLDVGWSRSPTRDLRLDIPSQTPRFADICAVEYPPKIPALQISALRTGTNRVAELLGDDLKGTYSVRVSVAASNAATETATLIFKYDRTVEGLTIVGGPTRPRTSGG